MRLNDPSTTNGTALLDSLTTSNIEQIEIIKGGTSSIWGSNASAGVINIITKEAQQGIHGSLALHYGSYNTRGIDTDLSYKDEKITAQVLASSLKTDGFSALAPRSAEDDGYKNRNYHLKFGYAFDANYKLNLSYNHIKTDTEYDDRFSVSQANDDYSHSTSDQTSYLLNYSFKMDNYSATFNASKGEYDRVYYTYDAYSDMDNQNVYKANVKEYSLINAYQYEKGKMILGLEYKEFDGFSQFNTYTANEASYTNKAIFIANTYDIDENTLFETNLRYDNYDEFDDKATYKIGLKHNLNCYQGLKTSVNYYTSYDSPSAYQLANQTPTVNLLKPAYTKGYDISAGYKDLISINYFHSEVEDGIVYLEGTWPAEYKNTNGIEKFSGLEITSSYVFAPYNITFSANYTHLFDYEAEDGTDHIRRAKDTLNASAEYFTLNDTHFSINAQYIGDRMDTDGGWPASDVSTGNYTVWNLNFGTKIIENIDLTLNARNIFDKEYQSSYGYATEGRSLYAKVKYSF
jgi:vitamin B12 transporter